MDFAKEMLEKNKGLEASLKELKQSSFAEEKRLQMELDQITLEVFDFFDFFYSLLFL
jgi:hypothetical protein